MKNLLCSCIFLLVISYSTNGQTTAFTEVYYPNVNDAELAIIIQDYTLALSYYKTAFESVNEGFARDYRNAILCAIQTKNDAFAFEYLEKVILKSMDKDFLADSAFAALMEKTDWKKLMQSYDSLHARSLKSINGELLKELSAMFERDQFFRAKAGSYTVYGDTIAKIDVENVTRFEQLVAMYGFPSETLIGAFLSEQNAPYNIILLHLAQNLSKSAYKFPRAASLAPIIEQAAREGKCSPSHAGYLLSTQNDPLLNYNAMGLNQTSVKGVRRPYLLLDKISEEQRAEIDQKRKSIGLESLDEFRMKCQFRLDNPQTPFKLSSHQNLNIWDMDEAMEQDFVPYFDKIMPTFRY